MKRLAEASDPDIKIAGLAIWIHGRQFDDLHDYWDGNWLRVTAHCGADGAEVTVSGPFIHLPELAQWAEECRGILSGERQTAELPTIEPELSVEMRATTLGHITMDVEITPNNLEQQHKFTFEIDQSYLPAFIRAIEIIESNYPIRGKAEHAT